MAKNSRKPKSNPKSRPVFAMRFAHLHGRLLIALAIGVAVTAALLLGTDWRLPTKLLAGWDTFAVLYLVLVHQVVGVASGVDLIRRRAAQEDEGAIALLVLSGLAVMAALGALVVEIGGADENDAGALHIVMALGTIVVSWLFVHTMFALHYAHEYYGEGRDKKKGGLDFPGTKEPSYWDFVYFSLVIAMTSQVSDVPITSPAIRRVASLHGALSFFFNLGILALTINIVANLI